MKARLIGKIYQNLKKVVWCRFMEGMLGRSPIPASQNLQIVLNTAFDFSEYWQCM
jgi:hypothetical protein